MGTATMVRSVADDVRTAEPLRIARRLGYRVGVLQSSQTGHPVYLGLGFADAGEVPMFVRMPAA